MNRLMKHLVSVAFQTKTWNTARRAAQEAKKPVPPMPGAAFDFLRRVGGKTERPADGILFSDASEQEHHAMMRAWFTLLRFASAGCPIVTLDRETARGFAACPPPPEARALEWPLRTAYGLSIGDGALLVLHSLVPGKMPDDLRPHFKLVEGVVPIEAWGAGVDCVGEPNALANLVDNIGAALVKRPEGLGIAERQPSRQAARKQGLNPDHVASVEFVIGSEITLGSTKTIPAERDDEVTQSGETGRTMNVRTIVTPHWTHQVCGPRGSERRLQWLPSHWRGPEDAPVSVHAIRVLGSEKPPKGGKK